VAGIVAAKNNGRYTVGVAPAVELYSMRLADCAWGGGTLAKMIQGLEWAMDNGMDVVNMSFGFGIEGVASPIGPDDPPSTAAQDAFDAAYRHGIVLVAASGNSSTPYVSYPAAYASVIAVGATDDADLIASFSQTGIDQELTAPGVNNLASYLVGQGQETSLTVDSDGGRELEAIPLLYAGQTGRRGLTSDAVYAGFGTAVEFAAVDCTGKIAVTSRGGPTFAEKAVAAMNAGCAALVIHNVAPGNFNGTLGTPTAADGRAWIPVVSISLEEGMYLKEQIEAGPTRATVLNAPGNLAMLSGTSMASPHAAGVAALVLSRNPALTPDQVRAVLRGSADDLGTPGWDPVFGYGRINARRAVQQAF
jgi:serine protease